LASRHEPPVPAEEIAIIVDLLAPLAEQPLVLVGDFNALHPSDPVGGPPAGIVKRGEAVTGAPRRAIQQLLDAGYVDCFRTLHAQDPGYTYPSDYPWLRLDYVFASPLLASQLSVCDLVVGPKARGASDHLPIYALFSKFQVDFLGVQAT
jgi:exonuclease III